MEDKPEYDCLLHGRKLWRAKYRHPSTTLQTTKSHLVQRSSIHEATCAKPQADSRGSIPYRNPALTLLLAPSVPSSQCSQLPVFLAPCAPSSHCSQLPVFPALSAPSSQCSQLCSQHIVLLSQCPQLPVFPAPSAPSSP